MLYNKIDLWDKLVSDFKGIENDEELLIDLGKRKYVVRVATKDDIEAHKKEAPNG